MDLLTRPRGPAAGRILACAIVCSMTLHLRAEYFGPTWQVYLFKPFTTSLVIVLAAATPGEAGARYHRAIIAGLLCSLGGDIFLMLPGDRFVPGLACFLAGHLCYIYAFASAGGARWSSGLLLPYVIYYFGFITLLWPHLGSLVLPVVVYGLVLTAMGWQAVERWASSRTAPAARAAIGGTLFILSDSVLALDRFAVPFRASRLVVMTTYIAAQWLLSRSSGEGWIVGKDE